MSTEPVPEYIVTITVTDTDGNNVVTKIDSSPISRQKRVNAPILGLEDLNEDDAETAFWRAMKQFRNHDQLKYELGDYPYLHCEHQCSSDCRRDGCNCDCGEYHIEKPKENV